MNANDAVTGLARDLIGAPPEDRPIISLAIGGVALAIGSMMSRAVTPAIAGLGQSLAAQAMAGIGSIIGGIAPLLEKKMCGPSAKDWSPRSGVCRCVETGE